jgi:hypothetical protein
VKKEIIVVIPVGPGSNVEFITDTIDSFVCYTKSSYQFILMDDSHEGIGNLVKKIFPSCNVLATKKPMGGWAGLYISLAEAYHFAVKHYHFHALLKLDTDALIIGAEPEKEALQLFKKQPSVGIAGQYPNEYDGTPWDIAWPRQRILNATRSWKFIARPIAHSLLIKQYNTALTNDYRTGESVFGGAYFMSPQLLKLLSLKGFLPNYRFSSLNLGEDHLFALLAKANGYQLASLSEGDKPFACTWRGLPAAPDVLHNEGKKIVHSVRSYSQMNEEEIRSYFRQKRQEYTAKINSGGRQQLVG